MGYFSNGTEGDAYEVQYCNQCAHQRDAEKGECCPVWMLHLLWNYDQASDEEKTMALDISSHARGSRTSNVRCSCRRGRDDP